MIQNRPSHLAILDEAYKKTLYEVFTNEGTIQLRVNHRNLELDQLLYQYQAATWALITAYNPYSHLLDLHENHQRHQNLINILQQMRLPILHGVGRDESDQWPPEDSLFIVDISRENAITLGQQFSQNAILYGELEHPPELIWLVDIPLQQM